MRNKVKKISIITSLCLLAGCTSVPIEQVDDRLRAWQGRSIDELIKYWGLPSNQRKVGEQHYAEWVNQSSDPGNTSVSIGTGRHSRHSGIGIGFTLFDLGGTDDMCSRLVAYSKEGVVEEITWKGTNNFCYEITPELVKILDKQAEKVL